MGFFDSMEMCRNGSKTGGRISQWRKPTWRVRLGLLRVQRGGFTTKGRSASPSVATPSRAPGLMASVLLSTIHSTRRIPNWNCSGSRSREAAAPRSPGGEAHSADGNITDQIVVMGTVDMNSTGTYLLPTRYRTEEAIRHRYPHGYGGG